MTNVKEKFRKKHKNIETELKIHEYLHSGTNVIRTPII